jgi:hypothetical protein
VVGKSSSIICIATRCLPGEGIGGILPPEWNGCCGDLAYYWSGNGHCSHIVAVYHRIGIINIFGMMSKQAGACEEVGPFHHK